MGLVGKFYLHLMDFWMIYGTCSALPMSYDAGVVDPSTFAIKNKHSWIGKYAIVP